jgi:hypothetical protein
MSGQKTFNVTAGISTASQPGFFDGIASALQAYQEPDGMTKMVKMQTK